MRAHLPRPRFPLSDWIEAHPDVPRSLARSGMRGELRTLPRTLARARPATEEEVAGRVGRILGVPARSVALTHGATEGNALVLLHLAAEIRRARGRAPRVHFHRPEYPPLLDAARFAGFRSVRAAAAADLIVRSDPSNPEGVPADRPRDRPPGRDRVAWLLDETFREFTSRPSAARDGRRGVWVTGTLTKAYGADDVRVGWVVPPPESVEAFGRTQGLLADEVAPTSLGQAAAVLRARSRLLAETRAIFRRNLLALRRALPGVPELAAPVHFDRGEDPGWGDRVAEAALDAGVLVAPGRYFGAPEGVRITLTRRSFPRDLAIYLRARRSVAERA
jgi:histidinol-phosphate/aromatic aminotransferase/cobyric acid decarboxylase-like protein